MVRAQLLRLGSLQLSRVCQCRQHLCDVHEQLKIIFSDVRGGGGCVRANDPQLVGAERERGIQPRLDAQFFYGRG